MNPPAFPTTFVEPSIGSTHGGMSLRDYFAANAMQGMLAGMGFDALLSSQGSPAPAYARVAYEFADAMLSEREKGQS